MEDPPGHLVRHQAHRPELESRPTHQLHDVERGRGERSASSKKWSEQHHSRHAFARAGQPHQGERDAPDRRTDGDGEQGLREAEGGHEQRSGQQDQQADREVTPQHGEIEPREPATFVGDRSDPPGRRVPLEEASEPFGDRGHASLRRTPGPQAVADRRARYRTTGLARPFSSAGPTSSNPIPSSETSGTVSSLANTSPGPAFAAMRAAMFTVRPK